MCPSTSELQERTLVARERIGMIRPTDLARLRRVYRIRAEYVSMKLGIGVRTIERYETGSRIPCSRFHERWQNIMASIVFENKDVAIEFAQILALLKGADSE